MSKPKYLVVSVPSSITPSGHKDDALGSIQKAVNPSYGDVSSFNVPEFKIGTLDALIQQSEDLSKLEGLCNVVVSKVGDTLKNILDGDEDKLQMHKSVNDSKSELRSKTHLLTTWSLIEPLDQYLKSFSWNKVKYRADKPIGELVDLFQKVAATCCSL